jgi:hypothetical protein
MLLSGPRRAGSGPNPGPQEFGWQMADRTGNLEATDCQLWLIWREGLSPRQASPSGASSPRQLPARDGGLMPLPSGAALSLCSGLGGRGPTGGRWRGEMISRGYNGRRSGLWVVGGSGGSNSIPCAQVITPGDWGTWGGHRAGDRKLANHPRQHSGYRLPATHRTAATADYWRALAVGVVSPRASDAKYGR